MTYIKGKIVYYGENDRRYSWTIRGSITETYSTSKYSDVGTEEVAPFIRRLHADELLTGGEEILYD